MNRPLVDRVLFIVLLLAAVAGVSAQRDGQPAPAYSFAEPGISPDGAEIAFMSGGDIWSVPAAGGDARLLVAGDATDRRPMFSPDGRRLAFVSTRTGGGDMYVLTLATGELRRLTFDDGLEELDGWSRDGQWLFFSSTGHDIAGMNDIFRVPLAGGTPTAVSEDRYVNEFSGAASPDGRQLAFVAHGLGSSQWWRVSGSHLDQSEIWLRDLGGTWGYRELTARDARQLWPMWSGDGRSIFYVADRGGAENVWTRPIDPSGTDRRVTSFTNGRLLWPTITADGATIAFERDFGVWTLSTATGEAHRVPIVRRGSASGPVPERVRQTNRFSDLALSPDGRKVAFVAHGDVFAASAHDGGTAARVTDTPALESQPAWAPDSRRLAYASTADAGQRIVVYDFVTGAETALTNGARTDLSPVFSPDGTQVAFLRNRSELHVVNADGSGDRVIATGRFADTIDSPRPVWSPDGKWIAQFAVGAKTFTNVELVPLDGGVPRPVSFLANVFANAIAWSPDGTFLLFDTRQRTEQGRLARVDLTLRTPKLREDLFRDLFNEPRPGTPARTPEPGEPARAPANPTPAPAPAPANPTPAPAPANPTPAPGNRAGRPATGPGTPAPAVAPVFADIRRRLSLLPVGLDVDEAVVSPDGKTAVITASAAGRTNLYVYSLDELATDPPVARQLTSTAGGKADARFTPDGKEVMYLDAGRIQIVNLEKRDVRPLTVTAEMTVDFGVEKQTVFEEAWTLMRDNFFDAAFDGVDWQASRTRYAPRIAGAGTPDEMRRVLSLMVGDLNASHLGVSGPAGAAPAIGRLGLRFDARAYETSGRLRVADVVPLGPAALTRQIGVGDVIAAVDGRPLGAGVNLDERLENTIDRRVVLTVAGAGGGATREVVIRPASQGTEKGLLYREWVENNREYVLTRSGGRLGYVHMINMSAGALDQLFVDLDVDNQGRDGVVVDIRNNSGGFVNAYAIDVFTRQPYLRMATRGLPEAPARTVLGQRALESPTVLVTNQHSLSDAEDFTEGYRVLKLGSVVGEPTAGWIIYTWNVRLVDGTTFRLPRMRVKAADGTDMERHPRPVDVPVTRPVGESIAGTDAQLDAAVRTLLKQLGIAETPAPSGYRGSGGPGSGSGGTPRASDGS